MRRVFFFGFFASLAVFAGCRHLSPPSLPGDPTHIFRLDEGVDKSTRIITDARINGVPVHLMLDTGCEAPLLVFAKNIRKLYVKLPPLIATEPIPTALGPGRMSFRFSEPCRLDVFGETNEGVQIHVAETPDWLPLLDVPDGIVGWPAVRTNVLLFSVGEGLIAPVRSTLTSLAGWNKFSITEKDGETSVQFGGGWKEFSVVEEDDRLVLQSADGSVPLRFLHLGGGGDIGMLSAEILPFAKAPLGMLSRINDDETGVATQPKLQSPILLAEIHDIEGARLTPACLPWENLPLDMLSWTPVRNDGPPGARFVAATPPPPFILVDTGNDGGVLLPPAQWREWNASHPEAPKTLEVGWMPGQEIRVREVAWAEQIQVGGLELHGVCVAEADPAYLAHPSFRQNILGIGLFALKRMDLVLDAPNGVAYAQPSEMPAPMPNHNRMGADFAPPDSISSELIAHVLPGSPADEAGLRNGDVLLKVDGRDVTHWRTRPKSILAMSWGRPAGTHFLLTVKRGGKIITCAVTTRDLLGPKPKSLPAASDRSSP